MAEIVLPLSLRARQSPAGSHHTGLKALFYGPPKSGKSFALASFPHPIFALACGENGIELYLKPELGDVSVFVDDADSYTQALEFALAHPKVASIAIDNVNLAFEDWMATWEQRLNVEEIKGGNWRKVKDPWKALHRKVMLSNKNVGMSAWPRGLKYVEETEDSGIQGAEPKKKLRILEQDAPHVEKMLPFAVDMFLKTEVELDKKFAPTSMHRITYMGGRRPASIPANELYSGKVWRFDGKKVDEQSPFDKVLKPIIDKWSDGAVTYMGLDMQERERELGQAKENYEDGEVGRVLTALAGAATLAAAKRVWDDNEAIINELPEPKRAIVRQAKDAKKKELSK